MKKELNNMKKLHSINSVEIVNLKESDIDSLSMLLFSTASYEYITSNLLSKRKFNILNKLGVFESNSIKDNRVVYKVSSIYESHVKDIYIKYYRMKFSKSL